MPISQNTALFSLLGTVYGGDGKSTFALPDLQGNAPMHPGQGQGLSLRDLGEQSGVDNVALLPTEIPLHTHQLKAIIDPGDNSVPGPAMVLATSAGATAYVTGSPTLAPMAVQGLPPAGGSLQHNNLQPYLTLNFCIALQGIFPARP
jgi:microcystin-dependent protein